MAKFITVTANPALDRSLTLPRFTLGEVNRADEVKSTPGGKGINAARVLYALGADPLAIGFSGGAIGGYLKSGLDREGIRSEFVDVSPQETRLAIVVNDSSFHAQTVVNEPGPTLGADHLDALASLLATHIEADSMVLFCGSLPPGMIQGAYARLILGCDEIGATTLIDSSGRPLREAFAAAPEIVKINRKELLDLGIAIGDWNRDGYAVVQELRALATAQIAVVTDGERGVWLWAGASGVYRATPPKIDAVSAVGSGDAFAAGLAFGLARDRDDIEEALRLAMACGVANALNSGAGYLTLDQIQAVSGKIVTVKMA